MAIVTILGTDEPRNSRAVINSNFAQCILNNGSDLTSGRVPFATTGGVLTDSANLTYNGTTLTITGGGFNAGASTVNGNLTVVGAINSSTAIGGTTNVSYLINASAGYSTANRFAVTMAGGTHTQTSGTNGAVTITPVYNQASGTAANTDLLINRTETAVGSGAQNLIDLQVATVSKLRVTNAGRLIGTLVTPASASATGVAGTLAWDADYVYVCTATDTWKRVAIATW